MGDARISQAPVETLLEEAAGSARVSQAPAEVLRGPEPTVLARVSQGVIEVLLVGVAGEPPPPDEPLVLVGTTYASVDLPDPSSYYLGFKDGRVLSFGTATRTLSDLTGQWSANDLSCSLADTDRSVRNVLTQAKGLRETPVIVRMISDADRRAQLTPTVVFRGALRGWRPRGDLAVDLEYTDAVGLKLARRGHDRELPGRMVAVSDFPAAPSTSQSQPIPIIYGTHVWWTGACPVVYVGTLNIGGGLMHTWVVAGHACQAVTGVYLDDVAVGFGATWFAPGQTGWPAATPYWDINSRCYTVIQGSGADADEAAAGTKTLACNVRGIETMGDGSGGLIEQSFLQYLHFFRNFVLDDYQSGTWPETPVLWEAGWCQINAQSFVTAQAESRRWVTGSGYVGQAYIGPDRKSVRDWLAVWNLSLNCRLGLNRYHQWTVTVLPGALTSVELAALPRLSDAQDVHRGSLTMEGLTDDAITRATVRAYSLPKDAGVYGGSETYRDPQAEIDSGTVIATDLALDFLAATPQTVGPLPTVLSVSAEDVAKRWIAFRTGAPIYRVSMQAGLCAYEAVDVGDLFRLTHFAGTTATGYVDRIMWCEAMALDIDQRRVTITALDVTHAYTGARTLEEILMPMPSGSGMSAPTGGGGGLIHTAGPSTRNGEIGVTVYYQVTAVFDTGEESKPLIIGPFTTTTDYRRLQVFWDAYPTGTQLNPSYATVTPTAMRVRRCADAAFLTGVVECDLTAYPVPEAPWNLQAIPHPTGSETYYYAVSNWYYLVGEGPLSADVSCSSPVTPNVDIRMQDDNHIDEVANPAQFAVAIYGRDDTTTWLVTGAFDEWWDTGSESQTSGSPWGAVTPGVDLPLTATSLYDLWPGKADEADNPWVTP
jgi:hypothetical protein